MRLDPAEILMTKQASSSGGRSKARQSRQLDTRSFTIRIKHVPTAIEVVGAVEPGHYSRGEMRVREVELEARLRAELEAKVARHLRTPGR